MAKSRRLPLVHPGEILKEDLMAPLALSINGLARDLRVPVTRMSEIVNGPAASRLIPRCGWHVTSARRRSSG